MSSHDGPVIDLGTLRKAQQTAQDAQLNLPSTVQGRVPIGFRLVPCGPVWQLLMLDPRDRNDEGVLIACGPISTLPIMERIVSELGAGPSAT